MVDSDWIPVIDPTPPGIEPDELGPELLPDAATDAGVVEDGGVSGLAWLGSAALLAVGVLAVVLTSAAWAPWALAVGIIAVAATVATSLFSVAGGPLAAAGRATQGLARAAGLLLQGKPIEAVKQLAAVRAFDWVWLALLAFLALLLWRRVRKKWQSQ